MVLPRRGPGKGLHDLFAVFVHVAGGPHHVQQLSQLHLGLPADGDTRLLSMSGRVRHVLRMIPDSLDVVHHMEDGAQALQILYGQSGLVDLHQVVRDGMVQKVDVLLYLIDLFDILLVQRDQGVHGPGQVLAGQGCHAVKLLDDLDHGCGRIKDDLVSYVFKLVVLPVIDLPVLARHA